MPGLDPHGPADTGRLPHAIGIAAIDFGGGTITDIHAGLVNSEVTLDLPGGRHVITAVITDASVKRLGLTVGRAATAAFKASSVFLIAAD